MDSCPDNRQNTADWRDPMVTTVILDELDHRLHGGRALPVRNTRSSIVFEPMAEMASPLRSISLAYLGAQFG